MTRTKDKDKGVVKNKPSQSPKVNELKNLNEKNKARLSNHNTCRGKKTLTKTQGTEIEVKTDFKGPWNDLEGYILDIGLRSLDKFSRTMKELERYIGATYSDSCQTSITTETHMTFPDPEIPTIIPDTGIKLPKADAETTYPEKRNTNEAIHQKTM